MLYMLMVFLGLQAQNGPEGQNFPPYPADRIEQLSKLKNLPLRADNSLQPYFPPIIDQLGWSCNQASSIGYLLTYELNRKRELDGELPENQMSPAFGYNILRSESPTTGVSYFDTWEIIKAHGCANIIDLPYTTNFNTWMNGYDKYFRALKNKVINNYSLSVSTAAELKILKSYIFSHNDNFRYGGLANVQIASGGMRVVALPQGTYDGGASVITGFGTTVGHALTIVGFNDEISYDFNNDGRYTNDVDINNDGVVDLGDWEIGGLIVVNSWGKGWGDRGKAYLPYRLLTKYGYEGGIWNRSVHMIDVVHNYEPELVLRLAMYHSNKSMIKVAVGCSNDTTSHYPDYLQEYPMLNYHGGSGSFGSLTEDIRMEFALDISSLMEHVNAGKPVKFFLMVFEKDIVDVGSGAVYDMEIVHYTDADTISSSVSGIFPILNNQATSVELTTEINFEKLSVSEYETQYTQPDQWLSIPLQTIGSAGSNQWEIVPDYKEDSLIRDFPELAGEYLPFYTVLEGFLRLELPFDFPFYGDNYSELFADEGGNLYLETQFLDYPYSVDKDLVFKQRKDIVPMGQNLFFSTEGGGLYYEASDSIARIFFECEAHLGTQVRPYRFCCNLYPDGTIEYHYSNLNLEATERASFRSGLSRGNGSQIFFTTASRMGYIVPNQVVRLSPYQMPPKTKIESNSYLLTRPEKADQYYEIRVKVTDKNAKVAYGLIPVSTLDLESPDIKVTAYPNPFQTSSRISFIVRDLADVQVDVFDLNGKLIIQLAHDILNKGQHFVVWDGKTGSGSEVLPGVYLVRIMSDDEQQHVKIMKNTW